MNLLAAFIFLFSSAAFAAPTRNLSCLKKPVATIKIDLQIENDTAVFSESNVTGKADNPWIQVCSSGAIPFEVKSSAHSLDFRGYAYCGLVGEGSIDLRLDLPTMVLQENGIEYLCHWE